MWEGVSDGVVEIVGDAVIVGVTDMVDVMLDV